MPVWFSQLPAFPRVLSCAVEDQSETVQALLRHSDVKTTLQLYSHSVTEDRMAAQGAMLEAILGSGTDESGLSSLAGR